MIDGKYKIKVDVLFGPNRGTVVLRTKDDVTIADINAPVVGRQRVKGHTEGDTFTAKGTGFIMLLGRVKYDLKAVASGDDLHIDIKSNKGTIKLEGKRVS